MSKKAHWGNGTWYLFHIIAEKITVEIFNKERINLIYILNKICGLLPCPTCSEHANKYLQRINFNLIKNNEDFKIFLFNFHNTVNHRTGKKIFTREELAQKYKNGDIKNIINYFMKTFFTRTANERMFLYSYQRKINQKKIFNYLTYLEAQIAR